MELVKEEDGGAGFGANGKPSFWIFDDSEPQKPMHIAFIAPNRKAVDGFHQEALKAGGKDNGAPGLRVHYQPHYYGAFIFDPDGHNIEAVCRKDES